jgi:enoyl-CoA hydratase/carnithine racemase
MKEATMSETAAPPVLFEQRGRVGIITMNRPETMNAVSPEMAELQESYLRQCNADDGIGCIIIIGTGRGFNVGADLREWNEDNPNPRPDYTNWGRRVEMLQGGKPVIAALNGYAIGIGFAMAMLCDIRIASDQAHVSARFVRMGRDPEVGISFTLPQVAGLANAAELFLTGRIIDAQDALRRGVVNEVVPHERLLERALEIADEIAFNPMRQVQWAKRLLYANCVNGNMSSVLLSEELVSEDCFADGAYIEAGAAFLEKRQPVFNAPRSTAGSAAEGS